MASARLILALMVANVALTAPLTVARAGAQLARLYGGQRVWLGVGAGWSEPEFRALGAGVPIHDHRLELLREALILLTGLFRVAEVSLDGDYVRADRLPLAPLPRESPRLLLGGGSRAILELSGEHADILDLNAPFQPPQGTKVWAVDARRRSRQAWRISPSPSTLSELAPDSRLPEFFRPPVYQGWIKAFLQGAPLVGRDELLFDRLVILLALDRAFGH